MVISGIMVNPKVNLQMYREWRVKGAVWGILISPQKMVSQLERQVSFVSFPHHMIKLKDMYLIYIQLYTIDLHGDLIGFKMIFVI